MSYGFISSHSKLTATLKCRAVVLGLCIVITSVATHAAQRQVGSVPFATSLSGAGNSHAPVFSADGRHVAFVSHANNLVTNDDHGPHLDLFVRDLVSSNAVLVSLGTNGVGGGNDSVGLYSLSSNAQVIAFDSVASNLAPGDTNRTSDIFVRDLTTGIMTLLTRNVLGTGSANGPSFNPQISEDGRHVIFESLASNLVTNDFNGTNDIFIHDLTTGLTSLVSVNSDGTASPDGPSDSPSISADGLKVAFVSRATNLVAGVTNQLGEVYLRDVLGGSNVWAMASHVPGLLAPGSSKPYFASEPILSADGRYVAFKTSGRTVRFDLQRPTNSIHQTFAVSGWVNRVDLEDNPRVSATSDAAPLALTPDGRFAIYVTATNVIPPLSLLRVDFESWTTNVTLGPSGCCYTTNIVPKAMVILTNANSSSGPKWTRMPWISVNAEASRCFFLADAVGLVATATNLTTQLYSLDLPSGAIRLLSTNRGGMPGPDLRIVVPAVSPDGTQIAWDSPDEDIVTDDSNRFWDVFVRHADSGETRLVSTRTAELRSATAVSLAGVPILSANGRRLAFAALDSNVTPMDRNIALDYFLRDLDTGTNIAIGSSVSSAANIAQWFYPARNSGRVSLSADGRYAAFVRIPAPNYLTNAYRTDIESGTTTMVNQQMNFNAHSPAISPNGRYVAYSAGNANWTGTMNLYLCDFGVVALSDRLVSFNRTGIGGANGPSFNSKFSPDGRWIVYESAATDLVPGSFSSGLYRLYGYDMERDQTRFLSFSDFSNPTNPIPLPGNSSNFVFSADGRFVAFENRPSGISSTLYRHELHSDLTAVPTNAVVCDSCANPSLNTDGRFIAYETRRAAGLANDVFVKDLQTGEEQLISVNLAGSGGGNRSSSTPLISYDARFVVFASKASDLVPNDNNGATDIFVRDRLAGVTHCLSRNWSGTGTGNRVSSNPAMSADGRTVAFQSFADDLAPGDYNETRDVFVVTLGGPDTDGDGMDDDWEMAYFSTLARDGSGDFDGDGASDRSEFQAGTNPANDSSVLRVLTLVHSSDASASVRRVTVLWSASPGRTYQVQFKDNVDGLWQDLGANITAAGSSGFYVDESEAAPAPGSNRRFYRVVLIQ